MAAGLKNGYVKFIKEPDVLKWATPPPSATIIATLPNSFHERAIFGFEKGAAMADEFVAPARRALFPVDNPAFDDLTEQGHALFDAALLWTISTPGKSHTAARNEADLEKIRSGGTMKTQAGGIIRSCCAMFAVSRSGLQHSRAAMRATAFFVARRCLLVAATSSATAPVDANIKKHFESLGMTVTMVSDINPPRCRRLRSGLSGQRRQSEDHHLHVSHHERCPSSRQSRGCSTSLA